MRDVEALSLAAAIFHASQRRFFAGAAVPPFARLAQLPGLNVKQLQGAFRMVRGGGLKKNANAEMRLQLKSFEKKKNNCERMEE